MKGKNEWWLSVGVVAQWPSGKQKGKGQGIHSYIASCLLGDHELLGGQF